MQLTAYQVEQYGKAVARVQAGDLDGAEALLRKILATFPDQAESLHLLAVIEHQRSRFGPALYNLDRALRLQPDNVDLLLRRGQIAHDAEDYEAALVAFDQALALAPDLPRALNGRAIALHSLSRHEEAREVMNRALTLDPSLVTLFDRWATDRLRVCDWDRLAETTARRIAEIDHGVTTCHPFEIMELIGDPARQQIVARSYAAGMHPAGEPLWRGESYGHDRIRLGFISADFSDHPVAHQLAGVFEHLDRNRFEVVLISLAGRASEHPVRTRLRAAADRFEDVQDLTVPAMAARVHELEIDVAVGLGGYTRGAAPGIFAHRCAPVQVNYCGYPGTMGAGYVDYIVADEGVIPEEHAPFYDEAVAWLPVTYHPTDDKAVIGAAPSRAELGLPEAAFVFCALGQGWKITPAMFDVWMRILDRVPGGVLWLTDPGYFGQANLRREAEARGVDPARLIFSGRVAAREDHLARLSAADLMLDTLPYNAHSGASDALWAGLPVLTCAGASFPGRVGVGLLKAVGLDALIAPSLAAYESLAVGLATNPGLLGALRNQLAATRKAAPLFQTARYADELGRAFETMYRRRADGLSPASFRVALR